MIAALAAHRPFQWPLPFRAMLVVAMGGKSERPPRAKATRAPRREPDLIPQQEILCRLGTRMMAIRCLDNRASVWPSGRRKGTPKHRECIGCEIGAAFAARAPWHVPPKPSQPAEVLSPEQRRAKAKWDAERCWDDQPWLNPMAQVAAMTPDDDGTVC